MLLATIAAVILSAAATALAASPSANDTAKGNSAKNKDFAGLVDIGGAARCIWSATAKGLPRSSSYPAFEAHTMTGPV
jgi:hypothetical protein